MCYYTKYHFRISTYHYKIGKLYIRKIEYVMLKYLWILGLYSKIISNHYMPTFILLFFCFIREKEKKDHSDSFTMIKKC